MIKSAKRNYYHSQFSPNLSTQELWKNLNKVGLCGKDVANDIGNKFSANELNDEFVSWSSNNNSHHVDTSNYNSDDDDAIHLDEFKFDSITEHEIFEALSMIKSNAIGTDNIPLNFLKMVAPLTIDHLAYLFNLIIDSGTYPSCWKMSRVIPIPKCNNPKSTSDFKPISILPSLSKTFEIILKDKIQPPGLPSHVVRISMWIQIRP